MQFADWRPNCSNAFEEHQQMYLQNKYTKWYYSIIESAKSRTLNNNVYCENHHIIPKSLGGNNLKENLIKLTAREHFICHWLLTKMVVGPLKAKMIHAAWMMTTNKNQYQKRYTNSRAYKAIRELYIKTPMSAETKEKIRKANSGKKLSDEMKLRISKSVSGIKNGNYGRKHTLEERQVMSIKATGRKSPRLGVTLSEETKLKLRNYWKSYPKTTCPHCQRSFDQRNYLRWHGDRCKLIPD